MAENYSVKSIWNFDDEVCKTIASLKIAFVHTLFSWELEPAYWILRSIKMEVRSKFIDSEKKDIDTQFIELEAHRVNFMNGDMDKGMFYLKLEESYEKLNDIMKRHGLFFREGSDPRRAIEM